MKDKNLLQPDTAPTILLPVSPVGNILAITERGGSINFMFSSNYGIAWSRTGRVVLTYYKKTAGRAADFPGTQPVCTY